MTEPVSSRRVLIVGADGFIGRHIAAHFRSHGDHVIACARRVKRLSRMGYETLKLDLTTQKAHSPDFWHEKLKDIDTVIYAAGLLNGSERQFKSVHVIAPKVIFENRAPGSSALFLSAVGIDTAETDFARYRRASEAVCAQTGAVILRAGLVLGDTSYGGSSLARGLAALPFVTPMVGKGEQRFNPVHVGDLAQVIAHLTQTPSEGGKYTIGGPETLSQKDMLCQLRGWLGLGKTKGLRLPDGVTRRIGKTGDFMRLGPISATAIAQLNAGVLAQTDVPDTAPKPRGFSNFLHARPAGSQDLWHARLYLLRPVLRLILALLWLCSGLLGLALKPETFLPLLQSDWLSDGQAIFWARAGGVIDIGIAIALLRGWRPRLVCAVQALMVLGYSFIFTLLAPGLWLLPLGGLLKNLPILALIATLAVLEDER